jgi:DNA-binding protein H-NS|tara:strand:+ start:4522 stop:5121 length:600 start_codon:yes stop_codon:yes gene_type:complete
MAYSSRAQKSIDGVIALKDFLNDVSANPGIYSDNKELMSDLKDQRRTASLDIEFFVDNKSRRTSPMSINTLKKYANEIFDSGFELINKLRINALDAINHYLEKEKAPNKRTKAGLQKKVSELEQLLEEHRKVNLILLQSVASALQSFKNIMSTKKIEAKDKLCSDSAERLRAIISINPAPYNYVYDNVVNISPFRDHLR